MNAKLSLNGKFIRKNYRKGKYRIDNMCSIKVGKTFPNHQMKLTFMVDNFSYLPLITQIQRVNFGEKRLSEHIKTLE
jgi:hypothetical protein